MLVFVVRRYVDPEQPRSRSSSKGEAPTSPLRRSRVSSESSSVVSEPNFGFEENVFTEDDIRRFENDYRMPKRNKDEIVEFKFGTLDRKAQLPMKKEEPKKQEQAPVTSLRSLRQAYTRQRYRILRTFLESFQTLFTSVENESKILKHQFVL